MSFLTRCKEALWSYTDFDCGLAAYTAYTNVTSRPSVTVSTLQASLAYTASLWYINRTSVSVGENAFYASINNLSNTFPNETDLQVLKGLSLLNLGDQDQYQSIMEPSPMVNARIVLKAALSREMNHPGTLHYLIHAFDVNQADTAEQARPYALAYGRLVVTASHAQHMPAHIWIRTGKDSCVSLFDSVRIKTHLNRFMESGGLCWYNRTASQLVLVYLKATEPDDVVDFYSIGVCFEPVEHVDEQSDHFVSPMRWRESWPFHGMVVLFFPTGRRLVW